MKNFIRLFTTLSIVLAFVACNSTGQTSAAKEPLENDAFEVTGTIQQQGMTTYQYGTHTLSNADTFYALTSERVELDNFVDKEVTILAEKVEGYPIDGGPVYLRVLEVKGK